MTTTYLSVCEEAARAAGAVLRDWLGKVSVRHKTNPFDLVTEADIAAQKTIESILLTRFPDHRFLGEEGLLTPLSQQANQPESQQKSQQGNDPLCWIADPLDGTTNFVHGVPFFGPSIALTQGNDVLCGVFYNPMTEEMFSAAKGSGVFLNGQQLQTSNRQELGESLISISFPTQILRDTPDLNAFLRVLPVCQALRRTGSTAMNLAYVAAGRFDATWAFTCHPWDIAAGWLLVQEAGGIATKPDGSPLTFSDPAPVFAAANQRLHDNIKPILTNPSDKPILTSRS